MTGDRLSHRFHHEAGQGPLESRAVDPGVDAFDEGGCGGDHPQDVGTGWGEPCGNGAPSVGLSTGCRAGRAEQGGAGQENGRGRGRQSERAVVRRTGDGHTEQIQHAGGVADGGAQPGRPSALGVHRLQEVSAPRRRRCGAARPKTATSTPSTVKWPSCGRSPAKIGNQAPGGPAPAPRKRTRRGWWARGDAVSFLLGAPQLLHRLVRRPGRRRV